MVAVAFSALVMLALVSVVFHWAMRVRLMKMDSSRDRIEWLSFRSGDDVLKTYEDLFPRSVLPRFCRFAFWTGIVSGVVGLCAMVILKGERLHFPRPIIPAMFVSFKVVLVVLCAVARLVVAWRVILPLALLQFVGVGVEFPLTKRLVIAHPNWRSTCSSLAGQCSFLL